MNLILKKRTLNGKSLGGYYTKLNGCTYNIVKARNGGWEVIACNEFGGRTIATGCKSLGWAETAIIESVAGIDRESTWIKAA